MTDQITEARRAKFEEIYPLPEGMYWDSDQSKYAGHTLFWLFSDRFEVYNAALDNICVELPEEMDGPDGDGLDDDFEEFEAHEACAYEVNSMRQSCREAIHAAGIKTK